MTLTSELLVARILGPLHRSSKAAVRRLGAEIASGEDRNEERRSVATDPPPLSITPPSVRDRGPAPGGSDPAAMLAPETRIARPGAAHPNPVDVTIARTHAAAPDWADPPRPPRPALPSAPPFDGPSPPMPPAHHPNGSDVARLAWPAIPAHDNAALPPRSIPLARRAAMIPGHLAPQPDPGAANPATMATSPSASPATHTDTAMDAPAPSAPDVMRVPRLNPDAGPTTPSPRSTTPMSQPRLVALRRIAQPDRAPPQHEADAATIQSGTFDPAPARSALSPVLRAQAARIGQAVTPLLQRVSGFTPPFPLGRDAPDTIDAPNLPDTSQSAQASTVLNVNVSLGAGGEPDAFRDALTDVLRDCARRQGLDV